MTTLDFREVRPVKDIAYLAKHLRQADRNELIASCGDDVDFGAVILRSVMSSSYMRTAVLDGEVIAIFGVVPLEYDYDIGIPWLLGTEKCYQFNKAFVKEGRKAIADMRDLHPKLVNYVDARNARSIQWLEFMGFTIRSSEPFGAKQMLFHRFEMGF